MFHHRKSDVLVGLAVILLDAQAEQLIAPQLVQAALKRTMGVPGMVGKESLLASVIFQ